MRRHDLLTVHYHNGMHRHVRKGSPIPTPRETDILYRLNQSGQPVVDLHSKP